MNAFESAISAAATVNNKENATAAEIAKAVSDLNSAKATFESAKKDGTKVDVTLSVNPASLEITEGGTGTITASVNPSETEVTWKSSNEQVATVSDGTVTGIKAGEATITATAGDKTATCNVTVKAATVAVTGVTLSPASATLVSGEKITLIPTISPEGATNTNVTWNSSAPSVVTVDSNGAVTVVGTGTADITVTTADGGKTATCSITVTEKRIEITGSNSVAMGSTATLTASVKPDGMTTPAPAFAWSSSDESVATVSGGTVTPLKTGTATITAKATVDNKEMTGTFAITVTAVQ